MNKELRIKNYGWTSAGFLVAIFLLFLIPYTLNAVPFAGAQSAPELLVSWKANNSVPPDYVGKVLPINGTRVDVGLDLLENSRLVDLSSYTIRWYVNDDLKESGVGRRAFSFITDVLSGGDASVRVVIVGYRGNDLSKTITIPIVSPELVIDDPYPNGIITAGINPIKALLYFFNITGLDQINFTWTANGTTEENATNVLNLDTTNLPSKTRISLEAQAQNIRQELERASATVNLNIR